MKRLLAAAAASLVLPAALLLPASSASAAPSTAATTARETGEHDALRTFSKNPEVRRLIEQNHRAAASVQAEGLPAPIGAVIVSPATGSDVAGEFEVTATRGAAVNLTLWVDGSYVAVDSGTDSTVVFPLYLDGPSGGQDHTIEIGECSAGFCGTPADGTFSDGIVVTAHPAAGVDVTAASSSGYFSPDADGTNDTVTVAYATQVPGTVTVTVTRNDFGGIVRTVHLGTKAAAAGSFVWNGRNDAGTLVANGYYRVTVGVVTSGGSFSRDGVNVVLDTKDPSFSNLAKSDTKVFPRKDSYRDSVTFSAKLSERATSVSLKVTSSKGKTVRTLSAKNVSGTVKLTWNGRTASGKIAAAGTYTYRWTATDLAGNKRTSASGSITVDTRILKKKVRTKTVTPSSTRYDSYIGKCAKLAKNPNGWKGGHGYRSNCAFVEGSSIGNVWIFYKLRVPKAVKYGSVKVGALGKARAVTIDGEQYYVEAGLALLATARGDASIAARKTLGPSYKYYWTPSRSFRSLGNGRTVYWDAGTNNYGHYDVRRFKVKWSYYVLVK